MPAQGEVIARVMATHACRRLTVLRHSGGAVTVHDHREPFGHAGWTMRREEARELGEALVRAAEVERHG